MLKSDSWCFKVTLFFGLMICLVLAQSKEEIKKGKKSYKTKPGYVKLKTEKSKGRQIMEMNIEGRTDEVEMEEKKLPVISKPPSEEIEDVSMYLSLDGSTACMKECRRKTTKCKAQCLRYNKKGYTYVSGNNAMDVESDSSLTTGFDKTVMKAQRESLIKQANTKHRGKRQAKRPTLIVPNRNKNTATLKVKLLLNDDVMKIFQEFVGGNATAAKAEAECFFTLAMNTVEMHYSSISGWGLTFKTSDNKTKPLDMSVWLHSIDIPPIVDNTFSSIAPLEDNFKDGALIVKLYYNENGAYLYDSGLSKDFGKYMRETYNATTSFNHVQVMTGYALWYEYYRVLPDGSTVLFDRFVGIAGFASSYGAVCENYVPMDTDLRYSFIRLYAPEFTRTMAHEFGHIEGAYHDESGRCDDEVYIMYPMNYPKFPDYPAASYYSFSVCSAEDFASYLSGFTSDELASCLYTSSPTEAEFLSNFCKGVLGSKYGIETYCEIFVGSNSTICPNGDFTFENGYLPSDGCEIKKENDTYLEIFNCADENGCENTNNKIGQIFDGTKCLDEDGTEGDKVCFRSKCSTELEICADYEGDDEEDGESKSESESESETESKSKSESEVESESESESNESEEQSSS